MTVLGVLTTPEVREVDGEVQGAELAWIVLSGRRKFVRRREGQDFGMRWAVHQSCDFIEVDIGFALCLRDSRSWARDVNMKRREGFLFAERTITIPSRIALLARN